MKMIAEYLDHAIEFDRLAATEPNPALKESLLNQAIAYRKLAAERAMRLGLSPPKSTGST